MLKAFLSGSSESESIYLCFQLLENPHTSVVTYSTWNLAINVAYPWLFFCNHVFNQVSSFASCFHFYRLLELHCTHLDNGWRPFLFKVSWLITFIPSANLTSFCHITWHIQGVCGLDLIYWGMIIVPIAACKMMKSLIAFVASYN